MFPVYTYASEILERGWKSILKSSLSHQVNLLTSKIWLRVALLCVAVLLLERAVACTAHSGSESDPSSARSGTLTPLRPLPSVGISCS